MHSKFHLYGVFFFRRAVRGAINSLQFGMNFLTKATIPKSNCKLVMLVGRVKLVMANIFSGLGSLPSPLVAKWTPLGHRLRILREDLYTSFSRV